MKQMFFFIALLLCMLSVAQAQFTGLSVGEEVVLRSRIIENEKLTEESYEIRAKMLEGKVLKLQVSRQGYQASDEHGTHILIEDEFEMLNQTQGDGSALVFSSLPANTWLVALDGSSGALELGNSFTIQCKCSKAKNTLHIEWGDGDSCEPKLSNSGALGFSCPSTDEKSGCQQHLVLASNKELSPSAGFLLIEADKVLVEYK